MPSGATLKVAGGRPQSSPGSGIFSHGEAQTQVLRSSHLLSSSFVNSSANLEGSGPSGLGSVSGGDMSRTLNSGTTSGPSVGASSLVTDANSPLSGGPHLQRSASINAESYNRLPASPMSFSSNNVSLSGSSALDGSSFVQQSSNQENNPHVSYRHQQQGASTSNSNGKRTNGLIDLSGMHLPDSWSQQPNSSLPANKRARLGTNHEDFHQQQAIHQTLHRHGSVPIQAHHPHIQALYQQKLLQQRQQQFLQSLPLMQGAQIQPQQQQPWRSQLQHAVQPPYPKRIYEGGICARRMMQYLYHQRHHPPENSMQYWRKFVAEYFSPHAKQRLCLSTYGNVGHHAMGALPQSTKVAWHCDICGLKSGKGFEATCDVLPRLFKTKFDSGVKEELLFLSMPGEVRCPNGSMVIVYEKAVQESVYEHFRVVQEGHLRIIFTPELKILSWEFCVLRHEELFPRRLVAPQVNQLVQVAQKYQNTVNDDGTSSASAQDLQTNFSMIVTAGRQLANNVDLQPLNELGFSKQYVRCLQMAEVLNSMKDLIDFSKEHNFSPIESLKNYPRHSAASKLPVRKLHEMGQQLVNGQRLSVDQNDTLNKIIAMNPGLSSHLANNMSGGTPNIMGQNEIAASKYQNLLTQNSRNFNSMASQPGGNPYGSLNQGLASPYQVSNLVLSGQNATGNVFASSHPLQGAMKQNQPSSHGSPSLPQDIQELLQMMGNNNTGVHPRPHGGQNPNIASADGILSGVGATGAVPPVRGGPSNTAGLGTKPPALPNNRVPSFPSTTNSVKDFSDSSPAVSENSYGVMQTATDPIPDIPRDFPDFSIFEDEDFCWKS